MMPVRMAEERVLGIVLRFDWCEFTILQVPHLESLTRQAVRAGTALLNCVSPSEEDGKTRRMTIPTEHEMGPSYTIRNSADRAW